MIAAAKTNGTEVPGRRPGSGRRKKLDNELNILRANFRGSRSGVFGKILGNVEQDCCTLLNIQF